MTSGTAGGGRAGARAGGALTGLGSASGGLTVGPETTLGKLLILASPLTTLLADYAVVQGREALARWEERRPFRRARKTLKRGIKDPDTPEARKAIYREQLADLRDVEINQHLAAIVVAAEPTQDAD